MVKYYLIPAFLSIENGETSRNPKYLNELKINWAGVYVDSKDVYVVTVNESKDTTKLDKLEENPDIILLDKSKKSKDAVRAELNLLTDIKDGEDEVEIIARLKEPDFTRDKIWVSD